MARTYVQRKSDKQEKRTAKEFGGRTQLASGAIEGFKGDVRTGERIAGAFNENDFLIENKYTEAKAYKLAIATWNKIAKEALRDNLRTPLMQIDILDTELIVMDEGTFKSLPNFTTRKDCILEAKGKSISLNGAECDTLLDLADAIIIDFYNIPKKLYVVRKYDFLRNLP